MDRTMGRRGMAAVALGAAVLAATASCAHGALIITEIMSAPNSAESSAEFVELYNSGPSAVDLSGYTLSRTTSYTATTTISSGSIASGGTAVLVNGNYTDAVNHFAYLWGNGINFIAVPWLSLTNGGATVEVADGGGSTVAGPVNYAASNGFPAQAGGASMYLTDLSADPTNGANWALSAVGVDGAYADLPNGKGSIGSPGVVPAAVPEPASLGLLGLASMMLLRRRR